jgi:response regulator RpfG family c-di-GMP phosphodiesterase
MLPSTAFEPARFDNDDDRPRLALPTLLFVDDEPAILAALKVVFRRGYEVLGTTDGEEALQWLATRRIDVIVCDQRMPKITGVEVLSRARLISPSTIRLLLTGYADSEAVMGAINDGEVHRFLQKPWDNDVLRANVEQSVAASVAAIEQDTIPTPRPSQTSLDITPPALLHANSGARIVQFPPHDRAREPDVGALPHQAVDRENVLIIERQGRLHEDLRGSIANGFSLHAARDVHEASESMGRNPSRVIVFVLDSQSPFERSFLKLLKIEHPGIIVIAVCEALDTSHMIELINHARIFRCLRYPVSTDSLVRHLHSAAALARQLREQPLLLGSQRVALDTHEAAQPRLQTLLGTPPPAGVSEATRPTEGIAPKPRWLSWLRRWLAKE